MRTGSLINEIMDNSSQSLQPEVGMGATMAGWTDRYAGTIIEVSKTGHRLVWQEDRATRTDDNGMSDAQSYSYERNPDSPPLTFTRRKDGSYRVAKGQTRLLLGVRDKHYDYSF